MKIFNKAYTFDDVLLVPNYSEIIPSQTDVSTKIGPNFYLNIPILSASMDSVTETQMAYNMALNGGIGVIHKNLSVKQQVNMITYLKKIKNGIVWHVSAFNADTKVQLVKTTVFDQYLDDCVFVVDQGQIINFVALEDLNNVNYNEHTTLRELKKNDVKFVSEKLLPSDIYQLMLQENCEYFVVVAANNQILGVAKKKWLKPFLENDHPLLDEKGYVKVLAAIGVGSNNLERLDSLVKTNVNGIVIDCAHGYSLNVLNTVKAIRNKYPKLFLIVGNIISADAVIEFKKLKVDALKVGIGPGSICTTRIVSGVGYPQLSAIFETASEAKKYNLPIIADGGIKAAGDITKAIAAGASCVMLGSLLAGCEESCAIKVVKDNVLYKMYYGMGSKKAMAKGSFERYRHTKSESQKYVAEGIESLVPYSGFLKDVLFDLVGGLKSGMGYIGAKNLAELQEKAQFIEITQNGVIENNPHSVIKIK